MANPIIAEWIHHTPLVLILFLFRCINTLLIITFDHPDEHFQGPEIAHSDIFGKGLRTWEWSSSEPVRSPLYSAFFSSLFFLCKHLKIDHPLVIITIPRLVNSCLLTTFDIFFLKWVTLLIDHKSSPSSFWIAILYSTRFTLSTFARTYINSAESAFYMVAIYLWQCMVSSSSLSTQFRFIAIVALNAIMRPTSLLIWPWYFIHSIRSFVRLKSMLLLIVTIILALLLSFIIDWMYFGTITSTMINFISFNFLSNSADRFGTQPPSWYFITGVWDMMTLWMIFLLPGLIDYMVFHIRDRSLPTHFIATLTEMIVLSMVNHKELRFLSKELPFMLYLIGRGVLSVNRLLRRMRIARIVMRAVIVVIMVFNLYHAFVDIRVRNSDALRTMDYMRNIDEKIESLGMLTPPYDLPLQSYLHRTFPILRMNVPPIYSSKIYLPHYLVVESKDEVIISLLNNEKYIIVFKSNHDDEYSGYSIYTRG